MSDKTTVSKLIPDSNNANRGTVRGSKMIEDSLQRDGFGRSVLVDKNGKLIAGNKTIESVANTFGVNTEVILVKTTGNQVVAVQRDDLDLDDPDPNNPARRLAYVDNLAHEFSFEFNPDVIMADMEAGFDFEALDIKPEDWGDLLDRGKLESADNAGADTAPQIDRAEELRVKWGVEPGQLWALGEHHRLICGDCTDPLVVERVMGGELASLVVTDPPYGVSYADKNKWLNAISRGNRIQTEIKNDHEDKEDTQAMWKSAFCEMEKIMNPGAVVYCFMPQGGDQMMMMMMMMMMGAGIEPRHEIIWLKNNHVLGRVDYAYKHESIMYAWKSGGHKFYGGFQTSILEYAKPLKSDLHPTMKPVQLLERLINNSSQPGGVVYEPFCGSGTTIIACENLGRKARAIEIDPGYVAVALERWSTHTDQTPQRIG